MIKHINYIVKHYKSRLMFISSMLIFGSIGIFRRYIPLSSGILACTRGFLGGSFMLLCYTVKERKLRFKINRKQFFLLCITGAFIGVNWIFLFESYNYTSVAVSTLCYYMQPAIVILLSPLFFKEKLTVKKLSCVVSSVIGIALVSGVTSVRSIGLTDIKGIIFGLLAAVFYSAVVIMNKKNPVDDTYGKTIVQLFSAAIILLPYLLFTGNLRGISIDVKSVIMIIIVGVLHTGIAYALYFGSLNHLSSQTVAIMSYIDPIFAIILSTVFLKEPMTIFSAVGAVMVIGAAIISETDVFYKEQ